MHQNTMKEAMDANAGTADELQTHENPYIQVFASQSYRNREMASH